MTLDEKNKDEDYYIHKQFEFGESELAQIHPYALNILMEIAYIFEQTTSPLDQ
ncbi:MAG: hypothetical protein ABIA04_09645 [Pseudomonadota bacterium]